MKEIVAKQRAYFDTKVTRDIDFRIQQLKKLEQVLRDNMPLFDAAIYQDFKKSPFDNFTTEFSLLFIEIKHAIKHLPQWTAKKRVASNIVNFPSKSYILPEPLGNTLIISAWNYPYQLAFAPVIAAMAAGNTIVLKPSELAMHTSNVMAKLIKENFDPAYFTVVEGGVEETTALLEERFDKIFFTGSVPVGKKVYQAAAKNLTPVTLELGGKSPALITESANLEMTAKRLIWAKFLNAGQTCIAPDYVLVHQSVQDKFIQLAIAEIEKAAYAIEAGNYVQIINERNGERLAGLVDKDKVIYGGQYNSAKRYFEPTLMNNVRFEDKVMEDEIFGPILPIISYTKLEDAVQQIKSRPKPLSFYIFTEDNKIKEQVLSEVSFGGACANDCMMHISNNQLPFGGIGNSGIGAYHGQYGFDTFSHYKGVLDKGTWYESSFKYPPYTEKKLKLIKWLSKWL